MHAAGGMGYLFFRRWNPNLPVPETTFDSTKFKKFLK
jgi:hypothetical protein